MKKILVVEDDNSINNLIQDALKKEGHEVVAAYSGTEAMLRSDTESYDLVVLDLMLPGASGDEFMKHLRKKSNTPVIVLSARDDIDIKVELLSLGANDYMTKPFDIKELIARIMVWIRQSESQSRINQGEISYADLVLNVSKKNISVMNYEVSLTPQEYKIMELLIKNPGRVYSKNEIYEYAWDDYYMGEDKTVNVHISNLRKKLKSYSDRDYIETLWGLGFKLKELD